MGYYTSFSMQIIPDDDYEIENKFIDYMENEVKYGNPLEDVNKWYDYEKDMREFSKRFPDTLFKLHGEGEESGFFS